MTITIKTNLLQPTSVLIKDLGMSIPANGAGETIPESTDRDELRYISESLNLRQLVVDNAFGVGSSTLILNDGVSDVAQEGAHNFLDQLILGTSGPYSVMLRDELGNNLGSLPSATRMGEILYSLDGENFTVELPITSSRGWLVNENGLHLVK